MSSTMLNYSHFLLPFNLFFNFDRESHLNLALRQFPDPSNSRSYDRRR
jgi:hypothetical protein